MVSCSIFRAAHKALALLALFICWCAWGTQIAGLAALQASCANDLSLGLNSPNDIRTNLATTQAMLQQMALSAPQYASAPAAAFPPLFMVLGNLTQGLQRAAHRTIDVFPLTPESSCQGFYRYYWVTVGIQFLGLMFATFAVIGGFLAQSRVGILTILAVATVLSIETSHTIYHSRTYTPEPSLRRGKVYFGGAVGTIAMNLLLMMILGTHDEQSVRQHNSDGGWSSQGGAPVAASPNGKPAVQYMQA